MATEGAIQWHACKQYQHCLLPAGYWGTKTSNTGRDRITSTSTHHYFSYSRHPLPHYHRRGYVWYGQTSCYPSLSGPILWLKSLYVMRLAIPLCKILHTNYSNDAFFCIASKYLCYYLPNAICSGLPRKTVWVKTSPQQDLLDWATTAIQASCGHW